MTIDEIVNEFPKLSFLKSPWFEGLPEWKQDFILELVEDSKFWLDLDKKESPSDGFKFLASTFGLHRAQKQAEDRELTGKEREEFLQPHQDLFTQYNPYSGRSSDR